MTFKLTTSIPSRRLLSAVLAAAGAFAASAAAQPQSAELRQLGRASHVIVPQARSFALHRPGHNVEIESVQARVRLLGRTASTTLSISLRNDSPQRAEAVLLLPVPDGAAVSSFMFQGASAEPTAKFLPHDEARRLYDEIVAKIRDPALLEFAGYNLVRTSVFPLEPRGTQQVRLTYEHLLAGEGGRIDYVLPRSESLKRHAPWDITVDIQSAEPISTVYSPSHELITQRTSDRQVQVRLSEPARTQPGPFLLSYLIESDGVSASLFAYPDPQVGGGYFLLMAGLPASIADADRTVKREVTLVIDRSGSMAGEKMDQVRAAALQVIEGLADGEAFNIIDYSTTVSAFSARPVIKNRHTTLEARRYLALIRPTGGTNIHDGLLEALRQEPADGMLPIVLFLTDGLPTVGRTSEVAIRDMVSAANTHKRRIFTFGVGGDVNAPLLDRIADTSRGKTTYVLPGEDVELKVAQVFKRLSGPVLSDVQLSAHDPLHRHAMVPIGSLMPMLMPDLFEDDQLIVLGQYRYSGPITFRLTGDYFGRKRTFEFRFDTSGATTRNAFVPRLWATRQIAFLIDQIRQAGADTSAGATPLDDPRYRELTEEILRLSAEFGVLTEYTAFLATEGTDLSDWSANIHTANVQLERRAVGTRAGQAAVNQSMNWNFAKGQAQLNMGNAYFDEHLNRVEIATVQQVNDRAFFRQGNRWVDGRLVAKGEEAAPDIVIEFGSAAHQALLRQLISENRQGVLSLPGDIVIRLEGRNILVRNTGR